MNLYRVWALLIRYALDLKHRVARQMMWAFFPALDIILFGLMGKWFSQLGTTPKSQILLLYLSARILWTMSEALYSESTGDIQIELESLNVINLFGSPLKLSEWITATTIMGLLRGLFIFLYGALLSWLFFGINLFFIGSKVLPITTLLSVALLPVGIVISALYMRYGLQMMFIRWTLLYGLLFLSAVFYPISILPGWLATISKLLPTTHLFSALQQLVLHNIFDYRSIIIGSLLIVVYTILAMLFLTYSFKQSKKKGLALLERF